MTDKERIEDFKDILHQQVKILAEENVKCLEEDLNGDHTQALFARANTICTLIRTHRDLLNALVLDEY